MTGNTNTVTDFRNTILNGDSVQLMRALPRNTVDFILTDPPYLVNYQGRDGRKVRNDDNARWLRPAFNQMHRVLKWGGFAVSFYGWNRIDLFADAWKAAGFRMVGHIVFRKSYSSSSRFLRYEHESAYLLAKGNVTPPAKPIPDVLDMPYSGNKLHPTQKPVAALLPLVDTFCPVGGLVLDPFAGSGSSLVAAQHLGRDWLGSLVRDRSVAEDIVQEAWLRFARAAADTQPSEPLRYLYRIVRNLSIDKGRREVREQEIFDTASPEHLADNVADTNPAADQIAWDKTALDAVRVVISAMPPRMRIAFEMHRFGGCKLREIAEHLNISLAMAHTLVAAAVDRCCEHVEWP